MKLNVLLFVCALALVAPASVLADADFKITEIYTGLSGPDGTEDWFEVTNFGDMSGDTATLYYEDESLEITEAGQLSSIVLGPGESAVFLASADATAIPDFQTVWGAGVPVGHTNGGGGGLSGGGDTAAILLVDGTIIDTFIYTDSGQPGTLEDITGMGSPTPSVLGVNGAFESNAFFNDELVPFDPFLITLVGSPGVNVPEPATLLVALLAIAGGAASRRR